MNRRHLMATGVVAGPLASVVSAAQAQELNDTVQSRRAVTANYRESEVERHARARELREKRRRIKAHLYFNDGQRTRKVMSFRAYQGESLLAALTNQRKVVVRGDDRRWGNVFVTYLRARHRALQATTDEAGNPKTGSGTNQLVFYVDGVLFLDDSIETATLPPSRKTSVVASLEEVSFPPGWAKSPRGPCPVVLRVLNEIV